MQVLFRLLPARTGTNLARFVNAADASLRGRLESLRERIARAAERSGRDGSRIALLAVTKTVDVDRVRQALAAGVADLAENRVQEAERKIEAVGRRAARWHLIGHLQSNKAARAAALFDRIHGIDRIELAEAVARRAVAEQRVIPVLAQVNASGESSKHGVAPEALEALLDRLATLEGIAVDGLMSIGPREGGAPAARSCFARTRALRDRAEARLGRKLPELSMGMSGDFETAIEEGSTMVRIGTALFGERG